MRYEGKIYRPPSEADAFIVQATIGCSWNHCTYCDMYRDKAYRVRDTAETVEDLHTAGAVFGDRVRKVFVAEGWVATRRLAEVRAALHRATVRTGSETEPILNELRTTKVFRVGLGLRAQPQP